MLKYNTTDMNRDRKSQKIPLIVIYVYPFSYKDKSLIVIYVYPFYYIDKPLIVIYVVSFSYIDNPLIVIYVLSFSYHLPRGGPSRGLK